MRDVIYVELDIVYSITQQLNETISRKSYFFQTVKSKVIISLFETVRLSVSISPRNLYNSLKRIKEKLIHTLIDRKHWFIASNILSGFMLSTKLQINYNDQISAKKRAKDIKRRIFSKKIFQGR